MEAMKSAATAPKTAQPPDKPFHELGGRLFLCCTQRPLRQVTLMGFEFGRAVTSNELFQLALNVALELCRCSSEGFRAEQFFVISQLFAALFFSQPLQFPSHGSAEILHCLGRLFGRCGELWRVEDSLKAIRDVEEFGLV